MTKSTLTREQLLEIIETDHVQCGEASYLARMALSAMDSESWCLPLDYLQGHKDGLEWASQLAEANHPETGDWLYDDPIELAKAIRKGPDMPPVQPVADSDPDRNPVLAYADSYRDMAKQGVESVPIWSVITDIERNIAPLYRHAQPAPVVPQDVLEALQKVARIRLDMNDFDGDRRGIADCLSDAEEALIEVVNRRAAMLQAAPVCTCPSGDGSLRWPCPVHPGNSPVIPEGYVMVPKEPTDEMLAAAKEWTGLTSTAEVVYIKMLAAAPQSPGSEPATVPGTWIPVSEKMPPSRHEVLVGSWWGEKSRWCCKWATYIPGHPDAQSSGWLIPGASWTPTHWMPLPAAPQEVKP
ncbi:TPA: DUF551 domain-containing protein [Klebsiella pneumoniae]|nr:DUF551 domain-containing protein [Klebsiella pneumoniae]